MTETVHFVQGGGAAVISGAGSGTFACACGHVLIANFDPAKALGIGIRCFQCGTVSTTDSLPDGTVPPASVVVAAPSDTPRFETMTIAAGIAVVGQAEMARIQTVLRPATPPDSVYRITAALLDQTAETWLRHCGSALPAMDVPPDDPFRGLRDHPLGWAVSFLRGRVDDPSWNGLRDDASNNAAALVAGFLHFVATWNRHPLFPAMAATVAEAGGSYHGLAPFAAAHCLTMMGNQIEIPPPSGFPERIEGFRLLTGPTDSVNVWPEPYERFEFPFGAPWTPEALVGAVADCVSRVQGWINLRHPGMLLLSPGSALLGFDEALIQAIHLAVDSAGRRNRGLMAVAVITLRQQPTPDPRALRFGYGFFPITNKRYQGEIALRA